MGCANPFSYCVMETHLRGWVNASGKWRFSQALVVDEVGDAIIVVQKRRGGRMGRRVGRGLGRLLGDGFARIDPVCVHVHGGGQVWESGGSVPWQFFDWGSVQGLTVDSGLEALVA